MAKRLLQASRKNILYIILLAFSALFILVGNTVVSAKAESAGAKLYTARVVSIDAVENSQVNYAQESVENQTIHFTARLTSGPQKGQYIPVQQFVDNLYPSNPPAVTRGSSIVVSYYSFEGATLNNVWMFQQYNRTPALLAVCLLFFAIIALIARRKSIPTILALVISCAVLFLVYIPALLAGRNIYITTIVVAVFIIFVSLSLIGGFTKKSLCAMLGNIGGVVLTGLLALLFNSLLNVTGLLDESYLYLYLYFEQNPIDLRAVVWSGIIIGSLGAVMDVAMTISSAINELANNVEKPGFKLLWKSGMNIGADAIGTMANTLILAYIGGSIATVLLLAAYNNHVLYILNLEMIVVEILRSVVGSIGILCAVPVTTAAAAAVFSGKVHIGKPRWLRSRIHNKEEFTIGHER